MDIGDIAKIGVEDLPFYCNRELNYLRMSYGFEKIALFLYMNFRKHLTDSTLYAMLLLNYK